MLLTVAARPAIIPKPVSESYSGKPPFVISSTTPVKDDSKTFASEYFLQLLKSGAKLELSRTDKLRLAGIEFVKKAGAKESYELSVTASGIQVRYSDEAGAFYAVQTLRQLLPPEIESEKGIRAPVLVPAAEIKDAPRFSWRGMHLDVSRHFFPVKFIKRYLDYIAMMKMNVFHWHLVDDGGWRIQIDKYPKLTSIGSKRYGMTDSWDQGKLRFDPESGLEEYGGFYTKAEIRDVVKYAAQRGITVVPEIEMPGHAMPVFAAYPELGCLDQPDAPQVGQPKTNVFCAGSEASYRFVEDVLTEVMELFPSRWIHIGGDEVWKGYWKRCSTCQAKMKAEGLKSEDELQSYFIHRVDKFLASKNRRLVGWDEILEGGLAPGATVMSWRGIEGGISAAKAGHDVVMSPTTHCYFDYGYEGTSTEHVYTFDPVPDALSAAEAKHILGGQANVWTESIPSVARCEYMIWPRMAAMAEVLWSPKSSRDREDFRKRLGPLSTRLDYLGTNFNIPAPQIPVVAVIYKEYTRVEAKPDPTMPGTLRFSYAGEPVTAKSEAYKSPIYIVGPGQTVNFAYVTEGGRVGDVTRVVARQAEDLQPVNPVPGWSVAVYEGAWYRVPDFRTLTPLRTVAAEHANVDYRSRDENFALYFTGYIKIEKAGLHTFSLSSDDGSWLKIGGATVVDNDGLHAAVEKSGQAMLTAGWHSIEIGYFQLGGGLSLKASMDGKSLDGLVFRPENP